MRQQSREGAFRCYLYQARRGEYALYVHLRRVRIHLALGTLRFAYRALLCKAERAKPRVQKN